MLGTLKNKEGKWVVEYKDYSNISGKATWEVLDKEITKQLPLHPDDVKNILPKYVDIGQNPYKEYFHERKVEFEIVTDFSKFKGEANSGQHQYAKLITKQGDFNEEGYAVTRVIDDKQEDDVEQLVRKTIQDLRNESLVDFMRASDRERVVERFSNLLKQSKQEESSNWDEFIHKLPSDKLKLLKEQKGVSHTSFAAVIRFLQDEGYNPPVKR